MASGRRGRAVRVADSRLYRRHYYVVTKNRGLESPRLFIFPSSRRFFGYHSTLFIQTLITHRSSLIAHNSILVTQRRLKDAKPVRANSRGFLNPWNNDKIMKWRLQRRGRAVRVAVPRLYRRHYCEVLLSGKTQNRIKSLSELLYNQGFGLFQDKSKPP